MRAPNWTRDMRAQALDRSILKGVVIPTCHLVAQSGTKFVYCILHRCRYSSPKDRDSRPYVTFQLRGILKYKYIFTEQYQWKCIFLFKETELKCLGVVVTMLFWIGFIIKKLLYYLLLYGFFLTSLETWSSSYLKVRIFFHKLVNSYICGKYYFDKRKH